MFLLQEIELCCEEEGYDTTLIKNEATTNDSNSLNDRELLFNSVHNEKYNNNKAKSCGSQYNQSNAPYSVVEEQLTSKSVDLTVMSENVTCFKESSKTSMSNFSDNVKSKHLACDSFSKLETAISNYNIDLSADKSILDGSIPMKHEKVLTNAHEKLSTNAYETIFNNTCENDSNHSDHYQINATMDSTLAENIISNMPAKSKSIDFDLSIAEDNFSEQLNASINDAMQGNQSIDDCKLGIKCNNSSDLLVSPVDQVCINVAVVSDNVENAIFEKLEAISTIETNSLHNCSCERMQTVYELKIMNDSIESFSCEKINNIESTGLIQNTVSKCNAEETLVSSSVEKNSFENLRTGACDKFHEFSEKETIENVQNKNIIFLKEFKNADTLREYNNLMQLETTVVQHTQLLKMKSDQDCASCGNSSHFESSHSEELNEDVTNQSFVGTGSDLTKAISADIAGVRTKDICIDTAITVNKDVGIDIAVDVVKDASISSEELSIINKNYFEKRDYLSVSSDKLFIEQPKEPYDSNRFLQDEKLKSDGHSTSYVLYNTLKYKTGVLFIFKSS